MREGTSSIRKPTAQLSLFAAPVHHEESAMLAEILHELRGMRVEQRSLAAATIPPRNPTSGDDCALADASADGSEDAAAEEHREGVSAFHELSFDGRFWRIITADGQYDFRVERRVGMGHIATLLQSPMERFTPMLLDHANGNRPKVMGAAVDRLSREEKSDCASRLSVRDSLDWDDAGIDPQCDEELRHVYRRLRDQLQHAYDVEDGETVRRLEPDFQELMKQFHVDHDHRGRVRLFEKQHWNRSRGNVTNAITRAIAAIAASSEEIARQLDAQIDRDRGFSYRPIDGLPAWKVASVEKR